VGGTWETHGGGERCLQGFGWEARREDLTLGGRITLKWALERQGSKGRTVFGCLRIGSSGWLCDHGNEPSGSIKKAGYCLTSWVSNILHHRVNKYISVMIKATFWLCLQFSISDNMWLMTSCLTSTHCGDSVPRFNTDNKKARILEPRPVRVTQILISHSLRYILMYDAKLSLRLVSMNRMVECSRRFYESILMSKY